MLALLVCAAIFLFCIFIAWYSERLEWNHGVCKLNGKPWKFFQIDSHGGRGYYAGDEYCWISYPFIDGPRDYGEVGRG